MVNFRDALDFCSLNNLDCRENKFTWSNKHEDSTFIKERLDRVVANQSWSNIYVEWWVEVLVTRCSNHKPIVLSCNHKNSNEGSFRIIFRYEIR